MHLYNNFTKYKFDINNDKWKESELAFFQVEEQDIINTENSIGFMLPEDLRDFYINIGYGFTYNSDNYLTNRLLGPKSILKIFKEELKASNDGLNFRRINFYEVDSNSYIYFKLDKVMNTGSSPIFYYGINIANNFKQFIERIERRPNYYLDVAKKQLSV